MRSKGSSAGAKPRAARIGGFAMMALLLSGCIGRTTEGMVGYVDPDGLVVVEAKDFHPADYNYDDLEYVKLPNGNYLVHRSALRRLGGYIMILMAAPITITIDTVVYPVEGIGGHDISLPHSASPQTGGGAPAGGRGGDGVAGSVASLIQALCRIHH